MLQTHSMGISYTGIFLHARMLFSMKSNNFLEAYPCNTIPMPLISIIVYSSDQVYSACDIYRSVVPGIKL